MVFQSFISSIIDILLLWSTMAWIVDKLLKALFKDLSIMTSIYVILCTNQVIPVRVVTTGPIYKRVLLVMFLFFIQVMVLMVWLKIEALIQSLITDMFGKSTSLIIASLASSILMFCALTGSLEEMTAKLLEVQMIVNENMHRRNLQNQNSTLCTQFKVKAASDVQLCPGGGKVVRTYHQTADGKSITMKNFEADSKINFLALN